MKYAVSICMLGYTRIQGVTCFDSDTKEFLEITPAVVKRLIDQGMVKGLKWKNSEDGIEFVCDTENWNQKNIPVKTACGKFRPLLNDYPGVQVNSMYTVVRMLDTDYRGRLYEVVSNKCCRVKITEDNLRKLASITDVAGCWITDNEIKLASGVIYENRMASAKDQAVEAEIEVADTAETLEDVFGNKGSSFEGMFMEDVNTTINEEGTSVEEPDAANDELDQQSTKEAVVEEETTQNEGKEAKKDKKTSSKPKAGRNKSTS